MVLWPNYILTFLCTFTFWALVGESPRAGAIEEANEDSEVLLETMD